MVLGMLGLAPLWVAEASPLVDSRRLQGQDRYATAAAIALADRDVSDVAILARGDDPADALAGSTLAGTQGGPLLLTERDRLSPAALAAVEQLGVARVYLLGGTAAISNDVENELRGRGYDVIRFDGTDRYDTARDISNFCRFECGYSPINGKRVAILANGVGPADAAAAAPIAAGERVPLLLTDRDRIPAATFDALEAADIEQVLVVGGSAVVSEAAVQSLQESGYEVRRLGGGNRQETAALLAQFERDELRWVIDHVNVTRGDVLADALAGGPHAGREQAPVLLTVDPRTLGAPAQSFLEANSATINDLDVFGNESAVTPELVDAAERAAGRRS